jgi:hypothetical protein
MPQLRVSYRAPFVCRKERACASSNPEEADHRNISGIGKNESRAQISVLTVCEAISKNLHRSTHLALFGLDLKAKCDDRF